MSAHAWELDKTKAQGDRTRWFCCKKCGAGPVAKDIYTPKGSITAAAKSQGFSPDCKLQQVKDVQES